MRKPILIFFGGVSAEHEVSVVTGLQVLEKIDTSLYEPHVLYIEKSGAMHYLPGMKSRKDFLKAPRKSAVFGKDAKGGFMKAGQEIRPYAAYLGFHGGTGEGGAFQGLLESCGIPFTSPDQESSALVMNKWLTKKAVEGAGIKTVLGLRILAEEIDADGEAQAHRVEKEIELPVIVKPAHLGSSIGIVVAKTSVELHKALIEASRMDRDIVIEKYLTGFQEFNCAVRKMNGILETSAIERPLSHDEILSFADKYEKGGKKTGSGMASLQRELPAKISDALGEEIRNSAKRAFTTCRLKGMVRIDFMHHENQLYLTEINPIPGSMSFYLWEASGIPFEKQITDLIEQGVLDAKETANRRLDYHTDIIERFVA